MAKIQNISDIHPTLGFTEFDILEKYRKSFNESELAGSIQCSLLQLWQKPWGCLKIVLDAGTYSVLPQRLPLWS